MSFKHNNFISFLSECGCSPEVEKSANVPDDLLAFINKLNIDKSNASEDAPEESPCASGDNIDVPDTDDSTDYETGDLIDNVDNDCKYSGTSGRILSADNDKVVYVIVGPANHKDIGSIVDKKPEHISINSKFKM